MAINVARLVAEANGHFNVFLASNTSRLKAEVRRSFIYGQCPSDFDFRTWCKLVDEILPPPKQETKMPEHGSIGAARVRESFNPSGDSLVDKIKRQTADLIDLCHEEMNSMKHNVKQDEMRLWSLAMTDYEKAAMWAVKAATTERKT